MSHNHRTASKSLSFNLDSFSNNQEELSTFQGCKESMAVEFRTQTMWACIQTTLSTIVNDEMIHIMKGNPISSQYVWERALEIFEQCMNNEREQLIQKMAAQLQEDPTKNVQQVTEELENQIDVLFQENKQLQQENQQMSNIIQNQSNELDLQQQSFRKAITKLKNKFLTQTEQIMREQNQQLNKLTERLEKTQNELTYLKLKLKKKNIPQMQAIVSPVILLQEQRQKLLHQLSQEQLKVGNLSDQLNQMQTSEAVHQAQYQQMACQLEIKQQNEIHLQESLKAIQIQFNQALTDFQAFKTSSEENQMQYLEEINEYQLQIHELQSKIKRESFNSNSKAEREIGELKNHLKCLESSLSQQRQLNIALQDQIEQKDRYIREKKHQFKVNRNLMKFKIQDLKGQIMMKISSLTRELPSLERFLKDSIFQHQQLMIMMVKTFQTQMHQLIKTDQHHQIEFQKNFLTLKKTEEQLEYFIERDFENQKKLSMKLDMVTELQKQTQELILQQETAKTQIKNLMIQTENQNQFRASQNTNQTPTKSLMLTKLLQEQIKSQSSGKFKENQIQTKTLSVKQLYPSRAPTPTSVQNTQMMLEQLNKENTDLKQRIRILSRPKERMRKDSLNKLLEEIGQHLDC